MAILLLVIIGVLAYGVPATIITRAYYMQVTKTIKKRAYDFAKRNSEYSSNVDSYYLTMVRVMRFWLVIKCLLCFIFWPIAGTGMFITRGKTKEEKLEELRQAMRELLLKDIKYWKNQAKLPGMGEIAAMNIDILNQQILSLSRVDND
jgi:hypothetical protein